MNNYGMFAKTIKWLLYCWLRFLTCNVVMQRKVDNFFIIISVFFVCLFTCLFVCFVCLLPYFPHIFLMAMKFCSNTVVGFLVWLSLSLMCTSKVSKLLYTCNPSTIPHHESHFCIILPSSCAAVQLEYPYSSLCFA